MRVFRRGEEKNLVAIAHDEFKPFQPGYMASE
jgi:hypothetical protein